MAIQRVRDVTLILSHVLPVSQAHGVGGALLEHLRRLSRQRMLVGTWAAAAWAIRFYRRHGFQLVAPERTAALLKAYWTIPTDRSQRRSCWRTPRSPKMKSRRTPSTVSAAACCSSEAPGRRRRRRRALPLPDMSGRARRDPASVTSAGRTRARPAQLLGALCDDAAAMTPEWGSSSGGVYREVGSALGAGGESHSLRSFCAHPSSADLDTPAVGRQAWCIVAPWQTLPHTPAGRVGPREFTSARRGRGSWRVGRATRAGVRSAS